MSLVGDVIIAGLVLFILIAVYVYAKMILGFVKSLRGESVDVATRFFWATAIFGVIMSPILGLIGHQGTWLSAVVFGLSIGIFTYLYLYRYEAKVRKTVLWDERTLTIKEKAAYALIKTELLLLIVLPIYFIYRQGLGSTTPWRAVVLAGISMISLAILLYILFSEPKLDERERRIREKLAYRIFKVEVLGTLFVSAYLFAVAELRHIDEYNIYGIAAFAAFIILATAIEPFRKYYERKM